KARQLGGVSPLGSQSAGVKSFTLDISTVENRYDSSEIIRIEPFHFVRRCPRYADAVIDHQVAEANAVDEHDAAVDHRGVVVGVPGELRGRYENSLFRALSLRRAGALLDFATADRLLIGMFPAVAQVREQGKHHGLEIGNGHRRSG